VSLQAATRLAELAEEGCALAAAGRLEELGAQQDDWDASVRALGPLDALAPDAAALVARAAALQGEQAAILAAAQAAVADELSRLQTGSRTARGYVAAGAGAGVARFDATA
jgi:hypothetical protein